MHFVIFVCEEINNHDPLEFVLWKLFQFISSEMPRNGLLLLLLVFVNGDGGKYSEKANIGRDIYPDEKSPIVHFGSVAEPFRMSRVNLLWEKARRAGLAEGKLERLYSKLKVWPQKNHEKTSPQQECLPSVLLI